MLEGKGSTVSSFPVDAITVWWNPRRLYSIYIDRWKRWQKGVGQERRQYTPLDPLDHPVGC